MFSFGSLPLKDMGLCTNVLGFCSGFYRTALVSRTWVNCPLADASRAEVSMFLIELVNFG